MAASTRNIDYHLVEQRDNNSRDVVDISDDEDEDEDNPLVSVLTVNDEHEQTPAGTCVTWRRAALLVVVLIVGSVLAVTVAPVAVSSHLPPQLFALRSAFSLLSITLPPASYYSPSSSSSSSSDYDPFYRISPATSNYTNHVCLRSYGGRWGNHIYMLNNAIYIALKHNLTLHLPLDAEPVLQHLPRFQTPCPAELPEFHRNDEWWKRAGIAWWDEDPRNFTNNHFPAFKLTVGGFQQYPTWAHASRKADLRAFYAPRPDLHELMERIRGAIMAQHCSDSVIVAIHIRAGDFPKPEQWNYSSTAESPIQIPITWYIKWLRQLQADESTLQQLKRWQDTECPQPAALNATAPISIFLATEDWSNAEALRKAGFPTINLKEAIAVTPGLGVWTTLISTPGNYWAEWWLLSRFRVLAASHSSFSLTAALQSPYYEPREAVYVKPDPVTLSIAPFDPWNVTYDHSAFTRGGKQVVFA